MELNTRLATAARLASIVEGMINSGFFANVDETLLLSLTSTIRAAAYIDAKIDAHAPVNTSMLPSPIAAICN